MMELNELKVKAFDLSIEIEDLVRQKNEVLQIIQEELRKVKPNNDANRHK